MKKLIAVVVFVSACATTGRSVPLEPMSTGMAPTFSTGVAASAASSDISQPWFPALASEAAFPSAARYDRELRTSGDRFDLAAHVCVAPNGSVASVELSHPSGSGELDRAATHDIAGWRFQSFAAPAHIRVCKQLAFAYEPLAR
jgi:outer membrane biosynthesis protein TonB